MPWEAVFQWQHDDPRGDGEIIIRAPTVGPYQLIVVCCDVCFC
jgi:hypothetical protein